MKLNWFPTVIVQYINGEKQKQMLEGDKIVVLFYYSIFFTKLKCTYLNLPTQLIFLELHI